MGEYPLYCLIRDAILRDTVIQSTNSIKFLGEWIMPSVSVDLVMNSRCTNWIESTTSIRTSINLNPFPLISNADTIL